MTVDKHHYSVPFRLNGRQLEVRQMARTVELFDRGQRVAAHARSWLKGGHTTRPADIPSAHRRYAEWTPQRLTRWAAQGGPATARVVAQIIADKPHPAQGFRWALGVMRLGETYGTERFEAACERVTRVGAVRYQSLKTMLERDLDREPIPDQGRVIAMPPVTPNIRGGSYFTPRPTTPTTNETEC